MKEGTCRQADNRDSREFEVEGSVDVGTWLVFFSVLLHGVSEEDTRQQRGMMGD